MPLLRLLAEGVGPFERIDLDLSDGNGKPHLGPHIIAGVNGSGKSTVLSSIAWALDEGRRGFDGIRWLHHMRTGFFPRAAVDFVQDGRVEYTSVALHSYKPAQKFRSLVASYAPSRSLRYLGSPTLTKGFADTSLAFEGTVDNEAVQSWLLRIYSSLAIEQLKQEPSPRFTPAWERIQQALNLLYEGSVSLEVLTLPELQLSIKVSNQFLNPSQLPEGVRCTLGWLLDFMLRQISHDTTGGLLLIDEIDAHLHPKWQRTILPALRAALPDVQIIVTSHSPFVISSCPEARIHVLERHPENGRATLKESIDAPFGSSLEAVLIDIFGVSSSFDIVTERELREWDTLNQKRLRKQWANGDDARFAELTRILSGRSEELRSLVAIGGKAQ